MDLYRWLEGRAGSVLLWKERCVTLRNWLSWTSRGSEDRENGLLLPQGSHGGFALPVLLGCCLRLLLPRFGMSFCVIFTPVRLHCQTFFRLQQKKQSISLDQSDF